jgi:geranylgeranyl reductase family protein
VNVRAANLLPFSLAPVTERTISAVEVSVNLRHRFVRSYPRPLTYMTQRVRLDSFLVEKAIAAGAVLRDGVAVRSLDCAGDGVTVRTAGGSYRGRVLVGADGANGIVARAAGLDGGRRLAVALEGHFPLDRQAVQRWHSALALDLGMVPGGYGWLFPKADHLNIGVGGWQHFAPALRSHLDRLAAYYGADGSEPSYLRGHRLPIRTAGAPLAGERVLLAGDAAGLIDPLSGEGIYAAIYSGRLAAEHALRFLSGQAANLHGYARAIDAFLGPDLLASQRFQDVFHLTPGVYALLLRKGPIWDVLCRLVRGEESYLGLRRRIGPLAGLVDLFSLVLHHSPLDHMVGLSA